MASAGYNDSKYFKGVKQYRNSNATLKKVFATVHLVAKQHQSGMLYVLCLCRYFSTSRFIFKVETMQYSSSFRKPIFFFLNFSNLRDTSQEVNIYVEEATWKPDYQLKQPFRNKRAYIYSLYAASPRVEISFDEAFLFS